MASPQIAQRLLTTEEFYELEEPEEGGKMELIDGEVEVGMPPSGQHGRISSLIIAELLIFARLHALGTVVNESGFQLGRNPDRVRAPEPAFIANDDLGSGGIPREGAIQFVPTLAVEVVSPNDLDSKVALKVSHYMEAGAQFVWVVRPKTQTVTVHRPDRTARTLIVGESLTSDDAGFAAPGFELPLETLFAE